MREAIRILKLYKSIYKIAMQDIKKTMQEPDKKRAVKRYEKYILEIDMAILTLLDKNLLHKQKTP